MKIIILDILINKKINGIKPITDDKNIFFKLDIRFNKILVPSKII